ncbi:unnamed protein product [Adineta steineri]|uniref:protein-tyrosine-phosphatase n=1 Tax=Adineta steineri TaxID=433720 RepID=A0A818HCZ0_9BILA|nr:unnamed protein product [Adineta steineri]CAF3506455.1 unnamed protein product [Adineta steineri]
MTKNVDTDSICNRVERLINEFEQSRDTDSTEIGRQFAQLQRIMADTRDNCPSIEGAKPMNRLKNRYKDVLPYDKHRVTLEFENDSDYINASFIEDFHGNRRYIAAQGPIDDSVTDFLQMIWEYQITSVICTANEIEAGRFKFRRYWPDEEKSIQFGRFRVSKDETSDKAFTCEYYKIRPLIISQGENRRHILLYHFLYWLDHDVPDDESPILELLLRLYDDRHLSPDTPILVHCSAGCGRTGSIIAIDLCRLLLRDEHLFLSKSYQINPIYEIASHIRQFRIALIQTVKQYLFVHKMFVFIMKSNNNIALQSLANNDENQALHSSLSSMKSSSPSSISSSSRRSSGHASIQLRNPPVGRRVKINTNTSNKPSPLLLLSDFYLPLPQITAIENKSEQPPPIPPRSSLLNTTNKHIEGQFVRPGETPIKAKRTIFRSRNVKRREPTVTTTTATLKSVRSDSADPLSDPSSRHHQRNSTYRHQIIDEQGTNSD